MYQLTLVEEKMVEDMRLRMEQKEREEKEVKWEVFRHPVYENMLE